MTIENILYQLLVYIHLAAFAAALVQVVKEDWRLLFQPRLDFYDLENIASRLVWLLCTLWGSGLVLVALKFGTDWQALLSNAKLMAKITVVSVLTINGYYLHKVDFPQLYRRRSDQPDLISALGAISSTSWIAASLIGACRTLGPVMEYGDFIALYLLALGFSALVAFGVMSNKLLRFCRKPRAQRYKKMAL